MLKLSADTHSTITFWGMAMIALGLPLSVFLVSVGTFVLAGNWLLQGNYKKHLSSFFKDRLSLILVSIFFLFVLGMITTEDLDQGFKELRIKLPILLMPLLLFTSKLPSPKRIQDVLMLFVLACVVGSIIGMFKYVGLSEAELLNPRKLSVFISHIRFGLMLAFAFFILAYFLHAKAAVWSMTEKLVTVATMLWILGFLILLEAITAYLAFGAVAAYSLMRIFILNRNLKLKFALGLVFLIVVSVLSIFAWNIHTTHFSEVPFNHLTLNVKTLNGNYYSHQKDVLYRENGHRVWNFVCDEELRKGWPTKSAIDFDGMDAKGQPIRYTAIRYMTSKGLMKDSVGLQALTTEDISNIELGYTNFKYTDRFGLANRFDQFLWGLEEYKWHENANNSSSLQRLVYLKVGWSIFKEHWLLGVGTGDLFLAYKEAYAKDDRGMSEKFQGISHNQFLSIGITLGLFGFLWFLFAFFYPAYLYRSDYLYISFIFLIVVSFLSDNTFDRQSGVTLFAFFNALLIIRRESVEPSRPD